MKDKRCLKKIASVRRGVLGLGLISFTLFILTGCQTVSTTKPLSLIELRTKGAVLQSHQYTCGAAALATLMTILGRPTTEAEILEVVFEEEILLEVDEEIGIYLPGLTLADLERAARAKDFRVVSVKAHTGEEAIKAIESLRPVIVRLLLYGDILHFVVIKEVQNGWVYLSDPSYGNFKIPLRQLYRAWAAGDKIILTISRNPFYAWVPEEEGEVYLKRSDKDILPDYGDITPVALYRSARERALNRDFLPR